MDIAIIGTGRVGRVLGERWAALGHRVCFGTRTPEAAADWVQEAGATVTQPAAAAAAADVVVLAVPGTAAEAVVETLGDLSGKVLVDCTNPLRSDRTPLPEQSAAERIAARVPGAHVVKAFNTTGSQNMANPVYPDGRLVMPICGDAADAKATVAALAEALGFVVMDNGPLRQARALEAMAFVWINQAYGQGWGADFGFSLLRR